MSTATATGAICSVPIWVVMTPSRISENGAATSAPGKGGEHGREGEPLRQPRDQYVRRRPGGSADEQHHEERATNEPGGFAQREHEDLREHDGLSLIHI